MRRLLALFIIIAVSFIFADNLKATEVSFVIDGKILKIEPSKSITVVITKSKSIELGLVDIKTVAVMDSKELYDGVTQAAIIAGISGGIGSSIGAVNLPKGLRYENSKLKNAGLVGIVAASCGAMARATYNYLTRKSPMTIYDANNENLKNPAVINLLSIGTRVRIIQKNYINGNTL